jgi:hypothetical protein
MDPAQNEFRSLRQLLALKRHEQPPPGYFDRLSGAIGRRIAAEASEPEPLGWLAGLLAGFELRPAVLGLFALLLGGVYLMGFSASRDVVRQSWQAQAVPERAPGIQNLTAWAPGPNARGARSVQETSTAPVFSAGYPDPFGAWAPSRMPGAIAPASYQPTLR